MSKLKNIRFNKKAMLDNSVFISIASLLLSILVGAIVIFICGYSPVEAYGAILVGSFGSQRAVIQTLIQATPLVFAGLAFYFARNATLINLGIEGQLYMGALATSIVGVMDFGLPAFIHIPLTFLAGMALGGLYGALVGFLKVKYGSNEVIATIMLNFIAIGIVNYMVNFPLKAEGSILAQSEKLLETAYLPRFVSKYQLSIGILIAIAIAFIIKYIMDKTVFGYEIKAVGNNILAAKTAGIKVGKIMIIAMFISGAIAGAAGATHVMGVDRKLISGFSPGYGFDGIAVAALAGSNPLAIILSGILFGALRAGAIELNLMTDVPTDFVYVIQGLVVIFVSAPMFIKMLFGNKKEVTTR